jgi:hypothetical protein
LFSVPVIVLEPIKPIAAYLAATGQFLIGPLLNRPATTCAAPASRK